MSSTLILDKSILFKTFLAALIVIIGVMLKDTGKEYSEHKGIKENQTLMMLGISLFAVGWLCVAYVTSDGRVDNRKSVICLTSSLSILAIGARSSATDW